ncbi:aquaporin [Isoptericola sp. F-RaC21]|uniref:MIP/aquaporin family protein n=1 Tax=Isoptericola sp. F-RaC21 TaxID=3141452 RepID=UPI00315BE47B
MSQDIAAESGTASVDVETAAAPTEYGLFARLAAEAFGTFVLVLGIVGTATFNAVNNSQILPVALAGGILVMGAIAAVGGVSGGHFNPAVTFGLTLAGRASWRDLVPYWLAQLVGGTAAAAVMFSIIPDTFPALTGAEDKAAVFQGTANGFGAHSPLAALTASAAQSGGTPAEFSMWAAILVEVIVTAVFVGVILGVTSKRSKITFAPVVIGLTLGAMLIVAWPVTNASLNPARSFASAVFGGGWTWGQLWVFIVAPLLGGALAALFYRAFAPIPSLSRVEVGSAAGDDLGDEPRQHDVVDDGALPAQAEVDENEGEWDRAGVDEPAPREDGPEGKGDAPRA